MCDFNLPVLPVKMQWSVEEDMKGDTEQKEQGTQYSRTSDVSTSFLVVFFFLHEKLVGPTLHWPICRHRRLQHHSYYTPSPYSAGRSRCSQQRGWPFRYWGRCAGWHGTTDWVRIRNRDGPILIDQRSFGGGVAPGRNNETHFISGLQKYFIPGARYDKEDQSGLHEVWCITVVAVTFFCVALPFGVIGTLNNWGLQRCDKLTSDSWP